MRPDSEISDLIGLVYQGPLEERPWSGFLGARRLATCKPRGDDHERAADRDGPRAPRVHWACLHTPKVVSRNAELVVQT
jgi:hypothetical protein